MYKDCTFLLSSYDGGEDCWEGFFTALADRWPNFDMPVVLNTETKDYSFPGFDIKTFGLCKNGKKMPWAKRLKETLKKIDTEFVLLFLEDFWLTEPVDIDFFDKTLQWMRDNPDVANFSFYPCLPGTNIQDNRFERFEKRPQKCEYKFNCQAGLFRRKRFIKFLRSHESPWDFEIFGSMRATRFQDSFYVLKEGVKPVFSYGDNLKGCMIRRGKWVEDQVVPLQQRYNLKIDFSIRGFEDFDALKRDAEKVDTRTFWDKLKEPGLSGKIKRKIKFHWTKILSLI